MIDADQCRSFGEMTMHRHIMTLRKTAARALLIWIALFCFFTLLFFAHPTFAQTTAFEQFGTASTLPTDNIAIIIARVIRAVLGVTGIIFTILVIYAGFLYLTARGEPEPTKKAKKIFQQSIIGLLIMFSAYGITTFILSRLLAAAFTGSSAFVADAYSESLSGALGGGILDDHYPERNATDIPRNTRIFVSFKEPIAPETMIDGYVEGEGGTNLNTESVVIYPTEQGIAGALGPDEVVVTYDDYLEIFVFKPVEYLGSPDVDTNYTVLLTTNIETSDGEPAFSGSYASGYSWTFEVSTEVDLTPPYVLSVVPVKDAIEPRNITVEINFNEAMDPIASTGSYLFDVTPLFTNIQVLDESGAIIQGAYEISNAYRTISFTTIDACGEDPCGDTIYCLPGNENISALAKAATLNEEEIPQAQPAGVTFDGLVDAAANSLDGDGDGQACGSEIDTIACTDGSINDNYEWDFETTNEVEDTVPQIIDLDPNIEEGESSQTSDAQATFNIYLKSSTVKTDSVSLWPDPYYEFWFAVRKENDEVNKRTTVLLEHPTLVSTADGGWDYWPVFTNDIKSAYQICMYPAIGVGTNCDSSEEGRDSDYPYCCNGIASKYACPTDTQYEAGSGQTLPNNTETEL